MFISKDPVCDMPVDETKTKYATVYRGKTHYFCSAACKKVFDLAPEKYITTEETPRLET